MDLISRSFSAGTSSKEEDTDTTGAIVENDLNNWSLLKISKRSVYQYKPLSILSNNNIKIDEKPISTLVIMRSSL